MPGTPEQALIALYRATARRLRLRVTAAIRSGNLGTAAYYAQQLEAVRVELRHLGARSPRLSLATTRDAYNLGLDLGERGFRRVVRLDEVRGPAFSFTGSHRDAMELAADNLSHRLDDTIEVVGRRVDDVFRRVSLEQATIEGVAGGAERRAVSRSIEQRLVREGATDALTGFVDRAGKRWALDTYAEMSARTTTRELVSLGTKNRLLEHGHDLVTISDHGTTTEICKEFEGNTYSLTGATEGYDVLPDEPPFHPNCQHVMGAGTGDLDADLDALEAELAA